MLVPSASAALLSLCTFTLVAGCGSPRGTVAQHSRLDFEPEARWALAIDASHRATATGIAVVGDGAVVAGSFEGTLATDAAPLTSAGAADGFVAALDGAGAIRWARRLGGAGHDSITAVAGAPAGRVAIAGTIEGEAEVFGRAVRARGSRDAFVAMLTADGALAWLVMLEATGDAVLHGLVVDPSGGVIAAGYFSGAVTVGGRRYASAGSQDAMIVSLDGDGAPRFARRAGGPAADHAHAVAVSVDGARIYVAGGFARQADFGGAVLRSNYHQDGYLAAMFPDGTVDWVNTFGGTERDVAVAVAVLPDTGIAVAGRFESSDASFGGTELAAGDGAAAFVATYAHDGEPRWSARIGTGAAEARALVIAGDELAIGGTFVGSQRLAGRDLVPAGNRDVFVARFGADSSERGAIAFGGSEHDDLAALTAGGASLLAAGTFSGSLRLPGPALESRGASAAFALALTQ